MIDTNDKLNGKKKEEPDLKCLAVGNEIIHPSEKITISDGMRMVELASTQHSIFKLRKLALSILKDDLTEKNRNKSQDYI